MLYLPITKNWIVSSTAERVYLVCALLAIALLGSVIGIRTAVVTSSAPSIFISQVAILTMRIFVFPAIVGTALLSISMWYFWFNFDQSSWIKKAIWFLPLYLFLAGGPVRYYFLVYRSRLRSQ